MSGNLFIKPSFSTTLLELGGSISHELRLTNFTERESSNYIDGHYLLTACLGVEISLALTDDDDLVEYPYHLRFSADGFLMEEDTAFEGLADLVARKLLLAGYKVARCPDEGRIGADIWRYTVKAGLRGNGRNEIDIEITKP